MAKPILSATQLLCFLRCPEQYRHRYVLKEKPPMAGSAMQSVVFHNVAAENYKQKILSHRDLPLEQVIAMYSDEFDRVLASKEVAFEPGAEPGKLKDEGIRITSVHHQMIAPTINPLYVEQEFRVSLGENFAFDLYGIWDLVTVEGWVIDNKAYRRLPQQSDVDKDLQLSIYSLGYRLTQGKPEAGLRLDVIVKNRHPKPAQIITSRTNSDLRFLLNLIERVAQAIQSGTFFPNPTSWTCAPDRCPYWSECVGKDWSTNSNNESCGTNVK